GQKNCFPDRESNPGRGGELDYQGEMGTVLFKSERLQLRFLRCCKSRSARLCTTQYVSILKSTPFWWASIPQPLKWPIPLLTRRSMRKRTRFWMLFYTYFPCFLRISIHILNLHNFGLLGDRKSIPTPVDSSHCEHPVGPQRADEFRCRTDKGHFLHAPSQGWLYKQSGWPSGLRRCVQVAVSLEAWFRLPLLTRASLYCVGRHWTASLLQDVVHVRLSDPLDQRSEEHTSALQSHLHI